VAIAQTLGISLDWLVTGEGASPTAEGVKAAIAARRASRVDDTAPDSTRTSTAPDPEEGGRVA
jgi:hypothetical protein